MHRSPIRIVASIPVLLAALLAGCQATRSEQTMTLDVGGPLAIDVSSLGGDVIIRGRDEGDRATVHFERVALHGGDRRAEAAASLAEISTSAELVPGELGPILQVRAETTHGEPHFQRVHITIDAPLIDGVMILTQRGRIEVRNVAGECSIRTSDGGIRFMTAQALTRPITISNADGDIDFRTAGSSRGTISAQADDGAVLHRVRLGALTIAAGTDHDSLHATLNGGDNAITLRTVNGDIRIAVVSNPEEVGLRIFEP